MTLHNAPPTHWQVFAVALIIDAILIFALAMALLLIHATRRPVCVCDRGEDVSDWLLDEFLADHPIGEPAAATGPPAYIADPDERLDWMLAFAPEYLRRTS